MKKVFSVVLTVVFLLTCGPLSTWAATDRTGGTVLDTATEPAYSDASYQQYLKEHADIPLGTDVITLLAEDYTDAQITGEIVLDGAVAWNDGQATLTYSVHMEKATRYSIWIVSKPLTDNLYCELSVLQNGGTPFSDAEILHLTIPWKYSGDFKTDSRGNHIMPMASAVRESSMTALRDHEGRFDEPYTFVFPEGDSELTLVFQTGYMAVERILLKNEEPALGYAEYAAAFAGAPDDATSETLFIDAERPSCVSSSSITPNYERGSAGTDPADPERLLLNTIGGDSWAGAGQWISYDVNVKKSGWYRLYLRGRQNVSSGMTVKRAIYIDDALPFQEADSLQIPFSTRWDFYTVQDGDTPYLFYLTEGSHTITLSVVSKEYGDIANAVLDTVNDLNSLYRDIISVTGTSPNFYQDYNLTNKIPSLMERIAESEEELSAQLEVLIHLGKKGSQTVALEDLIVQLKKFRENPAKISQSIEFFRSNISAVSSWVVNLSNQPLELDYLVLSGTKTDPPKDKTGFWASVWYTVRSIFASFTNDYDTIGDFYGEEEAINVWISAASGVAGRDQAQAIKQLTDEQFTRDYGVRVNVSTVKAGVIESMMAGVAPDVALFMGYTDPVNLAARGAIYDLTKFDTYAQVETRFYESAITPFRYQGGVYALPLTQKFPMLFYRTDIFEQFALSVPETWDEFLEAIPTIQGANMNVGVPDIFATLLYQLGGSYYNEDLSATTFDSSEAAQAFTDYCVLYSNYGLPLSYDFFNRFRTGEMPMAIADYTAYPQLYAAAPEIRGLWSMAPVPGTRRENGTVDSTVVGYGSDCAIILGTSTHPQESWEFLDWFTSDRIQVAYGRLIESRLGTIGRYPTANRQAFLSLPANATLRTEILGAWENVVEVPQIPASYYVGRNLTNAFRRAVYYYEVPQMTLHVYNNYINREIIRKNEEIQTFIKEGE